MTRRGFTAIFLSLVMIIVVLYSLSFAKGATMSEGNNEGNKKIMLANNGNAMYRIYMSSDADAVQQYAAQELADYLGQVAGTSFELVMGDNSPNGHVLAVGRNSLTETLVPELSSDELGDDGFIIRPVNRYVVIAGSSSRGTMNGVNYFLDRYIGVKWFSPTYTFVPDRTKLQVSVGNDVQVPRFQYREMFVNDGNNESFRVHNLLNGKSHYRAQITSVPGLDSWSDYVPQGVHNFHALVPNAAHHSGGQLLAMNEEVRRIASENLIGIIRQRIANGQDPSYGFSQQDTTWDPDSQSKSFADQHGGTLAAPIMDLVGDVANRVKAQIPAARVGTLAYLFSFPAPTGMTLPDNVVVTVAPIEADHGRSLDSQENSRFGEQLARWAEMSDHLVIWDYLTNFNGGGYLQPYPNLYAMAETIKFAAQYPAVKGYFGQQVHGSLGPIGFGFDELRTWVGARLLWNPDQDIQSLIDEFVNGYYGAAAPYVGQYIELLHQSLVDTGSVLTISTPVTSQYLSFNALLAADDLFERATAAVAEDPAVLERVQKMRTGVDYIILFRRAEFAQKAADLGIDWNPDTELRLQRFKDLTGNVTSYRIDNGNIQLLYQMLEIDRLAPPVPEFIKNLPESDWIDFQDLDFRLLAGASMVFDEKASDHVAMRLEGQTSAWGIQLNNTSLPRDGSWKLYANVRVDPGDGSPQAGAFRYGLYPSEPVPAGVTFGEVSDGEYHLIEIPWVYEYDPDLFVQYLWFQPSASGAINNLYVDRVFAVRVHPSEVTPPEVYNPGFETIAPNGAYPDGWQTAGGVWDSDTAHSGSYSIRLDPDPANSFNVIYTAEPEWIAVTPGQAYKLTGWIKNNSSTGSVALGVRQINAAKTSINYSWHDGADLDSGWTQYEVEFIADSNASHVSIYFKLDQQVNGSAWLDDINLIAVP